MPGPARWTSCRPSRKDADASSSASFSIHRWKRNNASVRSFPEVNGPTRITSQNAPVLSLSPHHVHSVMCLVIRIRIHPDYILTTGFNVEASWLGTPHLVGTVTAAIVIFVVFSIICFCLCKFLIVSIQFRHCAINDFGCAIPAIRYSISTSTIGRFTAQSHGGSRAATEPIAWTFILDGLGIQSQLRIRFRRSLFRPGSQGNPSRELETRQVSRRLRHTHTKCDLIPSPSFLYTPPPQLYTTYCIQVIDFQLKTFPPPLPPHSMYDVF